jgi:hypothetical protein
MNTIPAVPPECLNAERGFQADQRWHQFALKIFPPPDDEGYHFRFWVKEQLERKWEEAGLRVTASASYGHLPFVDKLTLYKARFGKRRVFPIGRRRESLFADRFVWLLAKTS